MGIYLCAATVAFVFVNVNIYTIDAASCGCKILRDCYEVMLEELRDQDEATCVSDAVVGTTTIIIYLKALQQYCPNVTEIYHDKLTLEGRSLYEVVLRNPWLEGREDDRPIIFIDAGQEAGTESVTLGMYLIEQLVACQENNEMISKVRWVILPSTNPDGQEFARYSKPQWRKNMRSFSGLTTGVDISRNFEGDWAVCPVVVNSFSPIYHGPTKASENETMFIQSVLNKHKKDIKLYVSIRKDGHSLSYPHGFTNTPPAKSDQVETFATKIVEKVNQRAGGIHLFSKQSIYGMLGKAYCGHSVDYAFNVANVKYCFEMRVFLGAENRLISKFQTLPRGYDTTLRNGYLSGIREMYNLIVKEGPIKQ